MKTNWERTKELLEPFEPIDFTKCCACVTARKSKDVWYEFGIKRESPNTIYCKIQGKDEEVTWIRNGTMPKMCENIVPEYTFEEVYSEIKTNGKFVNKNLFGYILLFYQYYINNYKLSAYSYHPLKQKPCITYWKDSLDSACRWWPGEKAPRWFLEIMNIKIDNDWMSIYE